MTRTGADCWFSPTRRAPSAPPTGRSAPTSTTGRSCAPSAPPCGRRCRAGTRLAYAMKANGAHRVFAALARRTSTGSRWPPAASSPRRAGRAPLHRVRWAGQDRRRAGGGGRGGRGRSTSRACWSCGGSRWTGAGAGLRCGSTGRTRRGRDPRDGRGADRVRDRRGAAAEAVGIARAGGRDIAGFHLHAVSNNLDAVAHAAFVRDAVALVGGAAARWTCRRRSSTSAAASVSTITGDGRFDLDGVRRRPQ